MKLRIVHGLTNRHLSGQVRRFLSQHFDQLLNSVGRPCFQQPGSPQSPRLRRVIALDQPEMLDRLPEPPEFRRGTGGHHQPGEEQQGQRGGEGARKAHETVCTAGEYPGRP